MARQFGMGWRRQAFDPRDRFFIVPDATRKKLAQWVDVGGKKVPLLNQGGQGSCGPNTISELIFKDQELQGLELTGASRHSTYWWTRFLMGTVNEDSGVDNRTMLKALAAYGFIPEAMDPYHDDESSMVKKPSADMEAAGKKSLISDYSAVVQALPQMKAVLASGKPFMFGFDCFQQIMSDEAAQTGVLHNPSPGESPIGGHDVSFFGYSDVERPGEKEGNRWPAGTFKFRNHWFEDADTPWGDAGYGYISYNYAINPAYAGDFWLISTVPGAGPLPPPPPQPPPPPPGPHPVPIDIIIAQIDAVFARAEQAVALAPQLVKLLELVRKQVDIILAKYKSRGMVPGKVIDIIDAAFMAAEQLFPQYAAMLEILRTLVDRFLPLA